MTEPAALYLDLLADALTGSLVGDTTYEVWLDAPKYRGARGLVVETIRRRGLRVVKQQKALWKSPITADTMIGPAALANLRRCVETVLREGVPGDLIETGVWRGGACIYMRAILAAHGVDDRTVWVADSFEGLPPPDPVRYPVDAGDVHSQGDHFPVTAEEVRGRFQKYGLLDERVRFLEGWFADTLPPAPIEQLAVARLDGDMYGSTWEALTVLYPKLAPGGFLIVDDYHLAGARRAVEDYRAKENIVEPIVTGEFYGAHWRRARGHATAPETA